MSRRGETSEIKLDISSDEKANEIDVEVVANTVDTFDISPSGRRAVISARGQILTIATDRGDITRVAPDKMTSRNQSPKWSADGKYIAFVSDRPAATKCGSAIPKGGRRRRSPTSTTKRARSPGRRTRRRCSTPPPTRSCTAIASRMGRRRPSRRPNRTARIGRRLARQQVGQLREAGSHGAIPRLHRADRRRRGAAHLRRQPALLREQRRLDRRRPLHRLHVDRGREQRDRDAGRLERDDGTRGRSRCAISSAIRRTATSTTRRRGWPLKPRRVRTRAAGAARGDTPPVDVRIDWSGLARRAWRLNVPGTTIGGLTPAPEGHAVALIVSTRRWRRRPRGGAAAATPEAACTSSTSRADSSRACLRRRRRPAAAGAAADAAAAPAAASAAGAWCSRAMAARCTSDRARNSSLPDQLGAGAGAGGKAAAAEARGGGGGGRGAGDVGAVSDERDRTAGHLHRQSRDRSPGASRAGLQRRLAHHEEPLLRREDARRGLERRARRRTSRCSSTWSSRKSCSRS